MRAPEPAPGAKDEGSDLPTARVGPSLSRLARSGSDDQARSIRALPAAVRLSRCADGGSRSPGDVYATVAAGAAVGGRLVGHDDELGLPASARTLPATVGRSDERHLSSGPRSGSTHPGRDADLA